MGDAAAMGDAVVGDAAGQLAGCAGLGSAPDRTRGRARTVSRRRRRLLIPASRPQVLEAGILQRISPEERKRQEVRGAFDVPGSAGSTPKAAGPPTCGWVS